MDPNNIPMPAEQEKQEAISQILDAAFPVRSASEGNYGILYASRVSEPYFAG